MFRISYPISVMLSNLNPKQLSDDPDDYSISYTVKGIRAGFEDEEVVRDP